MYWKDVNSIRMGAEQNFQEAIYRRRKMSRCFLNIIDDMEDKLSCLGRIGVRKLREGKKLTI